MIEIVSNSRTLYKGAQLFTALSFYKRAEQLGNTVSVTGDPKVMIRWAIILQNL